MDIYEKFFSISLDMLSVAGFDGYFKRVNPTFCEVLGYTEEEIQRRPWIDFVHPDDIEATIKEGEKLANGAPTLKFENRYLCADGSYKWISWNSVPAVSEQVLYGVSRDVTALKEAELKLRSNEARLRMVIDNAFNAFVSMDASGLITDWNPQAELLLGHTRDEAIGKVLADLIIPPQYREAHSHGLERFLRTGEGPLINRRVEINALHRNGDEIPVEIAVSAIRTETSYAFNAFMQDIRERKKAEEMLKQQYSLLENAALAERESHEMLKRTQSQLVQTEKLASLGQMVAGIAHEINNPLAFVSNNVAVLRRDVNTLREIIALYSQANAVVAESLPEVHQQITELAASADLKYILENLDKVFDRSRDGMKRIQQIVKDLRNFARLDESDLHEVDINAGIESTVNIISGYAKKKDICIELDLERLPAVSCYPAKINQVVLNLLSNAIDASEPESKVMVRTHPEDQNVQIEVIDSGQGIPSEVIDRIFDPFFTTKPPGSGTGLGLSISYGIIQEHRGTIQVESITGRGTRFIVEIPVHSN